MMEIAISIHNKCTTGYTPLLDSYDNAQTALFIPALLFSSYTGPAIRVREDGTDTEIDINFTNGVLDESAIVAHCGANNGYIVKVYDQSGNVNDWVQSTATLQPQIYDGAAVIKVGGFPAMYNDDTSGVQSNLNCAAGSAAIATTFHCIYTTRNNTILLDGVSAYAGYAGNGSASSTAAAAGTPSLYVDGSSILDTRDALHDAIINKSSIITMESLDLLDGTKWDTYMTDDTSSNFIYPVDNIHGILIYDSDQSANRVAIETALNDFLSIY